MADASAQFSSSSQIIRKKGRISKVAVTRAASQLTFPEFSAIITGENIQRQRKMFTLVDVNISDMRMRITMKMFARNIFPLFFFSEIDLIK